MLYYLKVLIITKTARNSILVSKIERISSQETEIRRLRCVKCNKKLQNTAITTHRFFRLTQKTQ